MITRVVGLGQPLAGDDGVGLAVVDWLRAHGPKSLELWIAPEASALLALLETAQPVVLVDAVVDAGPPGLVFELAPAELAGRKLSPSHGLGVADVIEVARLLGASPPSLRVIGISIAAPQPGRAGLSPAVAAAIPEAARCVIAVPKAAR